MFCKGQLPLIERILFLVSFIKFPILSFSEQPDHTKENVEDFLNKQMESHPLLRGPFLAKLECMKRVQEDGIAKEGNWYHLFR